MAQKVANDIKTLTDTIVEGLQEKKGLDITLMDLRKLPGAVTDFFVICTASSDRQAQALAASVEHLLKVKLDERPFNKEGQARGEWILLDYINAVVHIFLRDKREFYNIEDLWGDAEIRRIED